jgi:alpha-1,6-mannosyltransferase
MIFPGRSSGRRFADPAGGETVIVLPPGVDANPPDGVDRPPDLTGERGTAEERDATKALVRKFIKPGLIGSTIMALGAFGAGWVSQASGIGDWPIVQTVRTTPSLAFASRVMVFVGVAVLLQAWLRLGHHIRTHSALEGSALNRLVWWWGAPLMLAPVLFSRDVYSYIAQSRLLPHGVNPYVYGTGVYDTFFTDGADALWKHAPAPYGPLWMGLSSVVYYATGASAIPALIAFRLLALAGVVLLVIYVPRLARACGADQAKAVWIGLLNPLLFMHFVSGAHNDALMLGLLVAGMTYAMERHPVLGIALIAAAGAIKAPALVGLAFAPLAWAGPDSSWLRRIRLWLIALAIAVAVFVALNLVTGLDFGWFSSLETPGRVHSWLSPSTALGTITGDILNLFGSGSGADTAINVWRLVGSVIDGCVLLYLVLTGHRRSPVRGLGLALLAVVVFGPVVQPWYVLWAIVLLAAAGLARRETRLIVLLCTGLVIYSIASAGSTIPTYLFVSEGLATLISLSIVALLLIASHRARAVLLEDTDPRLYPEPELVLAGSSPPPSGRIGERADVPPPGPG